MYPKMALRFNFKPPKMVPFDGPSDGLQGRKTSSLFKRSPFDLESRSKCGVPKNGLTV